MSTPKEHARAYYEKNKKEIKARAKKWAEDNKEKRCTYSKKWNKENRDKTKQYQDNYRKKNPIKYLYNTAKIRAKRKDIEFTLKLEDMPPIPELCPLLEIPIDSYSELSNNRPSLDRIDNSKGYVSGNVQIVSQRANRIKNNCCSDELLLLALNLQTIEESL